jgi:hypothetical protein
MPAEEVKQLSKEEIDQLFQFTEKKLVRWYDLQIELVDHLACRIEEEMSVNSSLSFEAALDKVYKEFGIFGFSKVVQEKESQIHKAGIRMWLRELRLQLSWPKAILSAAIAMVLYQLTRWIEPWLLLRIVGVAYTITHFGMVIFAAKISKKGSKLLLLQSGMGYVNLMSAINFGSFIQFDEVSTLKFVIIAQIAIMTLIASHQVFLKVRTKAMDLYPEAFTA